MIQQSYQHFNTYKVEPHGSFAPLQHGTLGSANLSAWRDVEGSG